MHDRGEFGEEELIQKFKLNENGLKEQYLKIFRGGSSEGDCLVKHTRYDKDINSWRCCLSENGLSQVINLIETRKVKIISLIAIIVSIISFYAAVQLGVNQIEQSREQVQLQKAIWNYERMRNDRLEARDILWRREDLEAQGRLPK